MKSLLQKKDPTPVPGPTLPAARGFGEPSLHRAAADAPIQRADPDGSMDFGSGEDRESADRGSGLSEETTEPTPREAFGEEFEKRRGPRHRPKLGFWTDKGLSPDHLPAVQKLYDILDSPGDVFAGLSELNDAIEGREADVALGEHLAVAEGRFGFPGPARTLEGLEDTDAFLRTVSEGYPFLDPGADKDKEGSYVAPATKTNPHAHGAFTHRMQWYVMGRALERAGLDPGNVMETGQSLPDLYRQSASIQSHVEGKDDLAARKSLWTDLVDRNLGNTADANPSNATQPESLQALIKIGGFKNLESAERLYRQGRVRAEVRKAEKAFPASGKQAPNKRLMKFMEGPAPA